ncbi:SWI/SNF complex subunit SWI3B like [Actinidia chinensis var. chinensis]|uniref:SWI/SNF complex subunit SWI3B like n=1 Tax=Actinidia chinensis var. chinensis TaxID=1590841 RepID=A0A2R6RM96_ACTCC|nr:SWI/SNF complex subunit SWI3B like [Actinidia chinensis var. chinensis]
MTTKPPTEEDLPAPAPETTPQKLDSSQITNPTTPTAPSAASKETPATAPSSKPPDPPSTATATASSRLPDLIYIPTYSRWFSWDNIHECEVRFLPEFFDAKSPSKNPRDYKYYRNCIIRKFRENPTTKITFTEARKTIIGDVGSVRRVFDFLETWGLINYSPGPASKLPLKWEEKETKSNTALSQSTEPTGNSVEPTVPKKRLCSGCKTVCSIACFACDKYDLTLCARCYVRGNYRVGVNSTEFRRVEINEEIKADWTEKEILHLLEAIMHYGDDWKRVAEVVGGRSEMECVTRFIKLPFGEQFVGASDSTDVDKKFYQMEDQNNTEFGLQSFGKSFANKRMRLSPLADASNPIAAQAAFLSALVGVEVAEAAASAAVKALAEFSYGAIKESPGSLSSHARQQEHDATANGDTSLKTLEGSLVDVKSQLDKEEQDLERAIFSIAEVQMKEIQDKISHFEEFESQVEREWQQLQQMKNTLFVDQLTLLFNKTPAPKAGESVQQLVNIE